MRVFDEALVPVEGNRITVVQNHKDIKGLRESLESFPAPQALDVGMPRMPIKSRRFW